MKRGVSVGLCFVLVALAAGCGSKDEPAAPAPGPSAATTVKSPATTAPDPCSATSIAVTTDADTANVDGTTSYADVTGAGPQSATLTVANYAIPERDARGVLQPSGLEKGKAVVIVTVTAPEITPGTYVNQTDPNAGEKKVNFFSIYTSDGRALPTADHELAITPVSGDRVCGSLKPSGATKGASAAGTFTAKRIDTGPTTRASTGTGTTGTTGTSKASTTTSR
jgi:hypothetical protein